MWFIYIIEVLAIIILSIITYTKLSNIRNLDHLINKLPNSIMSYSFFPLYEKYLKIYKDKESIASFYAFGVPLIFFGLSVIYAIGKLFTFTNGFHVTFFATVSCAVISKIPDFKYESLLTKLSNLITDEIKNIEKEKAIKDKIIEDEIKNIEKEKVINDKLIENAKNQIKTIVLKHSQALHLEYKKQTVKTAYGQIDDKKWNKEGLPFFLNNVIYPVLNNITDDYGIAQAIEYAKDEIKRTLDAKIPQILEVANHNNDGNDFENQCLQKLEFIGWEVSKTKATGDQGVDLLAEKDSIKVAIQCKNHKTPIGNKAVQEVIAGRSYYNADYAIVICTSKYTPHAIELANVHDVKLLHFDEITNIESVL